MNGFKKTQGVVDFKLKKMKITWKGRSWKMPVNINKGIQPKVEEETGYYVAGLKKETRSEHQSLTENERTQAHFAANAPNVNEFPRLSEENEEKSSDEENP